MRLISVMLVLSLLTGCSSIIKAPIEAEIHVDRTDAETVLSVEVTREKEALDGKDIQDVYFDVWPKDDEKALQEFKTTQKEVGLFETTVSLPKGHYIVVAHVEAGGQHIMDDDEIVIK